jgi:hypothetical protein
MFGTLTRRTVFLRPIFDHTEHPGPRKEGATLLHLRHFATFPANRALAQLTKPNFLVFFARLPALAAPEIAECRLLQAKVRQFWHTGQIAGLPWVADRQRGSCFKSFHPPDGP